MEPAVHYLSVSVQHMVVEAHCLAHSRVFGFESSVGNVIIFLDVKEYQTYNIFLSLSRLTISDPDFSDEYF